MAKTLNEVIQSRLSQQPNQAGLGAGMQDTGAQTQNLLRAKSGKQVAGSGPAASSLAEQQAVTQTGQQLEGVQRRGQIVGLQQKQTGEAQEQAADLQSKQLEQTRRGFKQDVNQKVQSLNTIRTQAMEQGKLVRAKAAEDQMATLARLSVDKYVTELQDQGQRKRLDNKAEFAKESQADMFGRAQSLLEDSLEGQSVLNASSRDVEKELANMDTSAQLEMLYSMSKTAEEQAVWMAIAELGGATANWATNADFSNTGGIDRTRIQGGGNQGSSFDTDLDTSNYGGLA